MHHPPPREPHTATLALSCLPLFALPLALSFLLSQQAAAKPNCDVPQPPRACQAGPADPPPPAPATTMQAPGLSGVGIPYDTVFQVQVRPQDADARRVVRLVIETGATADGPWSAWADTPTSNFGVPPLFYSQERPFTAPMPTMCFRARFIDGGGNVSAWSAAKCSSSTPAASQLAAQVGQQAVTVSWLDRAAHPYAYYIETSDPDGSNRELHTVLSGAPTGGGRRQLTVPRPYRPQPVCVRAWTVEQLPGFSWIFQSSNLSASTPMNPAIDPGPRTCFETPGV